MESEECLLHCFVRISHANQADCLVFDIIVRHKAGLGPSGVALGSAVAWGMFRRFWRDRRYPCMLQGFMRIGSNISIQSVSFQRGLSAWLPQGPCSVTMFHLNEL